MTGVGSIRMMVSGAGGRRKREELIARLERLGLPTEVLRNRPLEDD